LRAELVELKKISDAQTKLLEDKEDELKTLKRRHVTSTKELMRQVNQLQRRADTTDVGNHQVSPLKSSLKSVTRPNDSEVCGPGSVTASGVYTDSGLASKVGEGKYDEVQVDKQRLITKIVQLQTSNASLTNKLEFMNEHVNQLMQELQNKSRIIQDYVLREETSYSLRPPSSTSHSTNKKTSVLNSVLQSSILYGRKVSSHSAAGSSLQPSASAAADAECFENRLQTALEDTLLKNVQYKENADRLVDEMSRLSQLNKQLQLELECVRSSCLTQEQ
jgi:hypothetical protein